MRRFVTAFVILGFVALAQLADGAAPRIALVIGNSGYKIAPPLANPANDARLMAETLRGLGFDVIERIDADRGTILAATFLLQDRLIAAGSDAVGLFFYAGHGVQVGGENYLIPLGADIRQEREVPVETVSASFVLKQMEFAGNDMNFVILDACRNNPFPASTRAATRGLARMLAPTGSLVAYSTGPGEVAVDGSGDNSPYVLALAEAMRVPGLPAELMFKRVRESVLEATGDKQTPWEESSLKGANFYFTVDVSVTVDAPAAAPSIADTSAMVQQESLFWESIKDSDDPKMFEAYLGQFPDGTFSSLAKLRLDALRQADAQGLAAEEIDEPKQEEAEEPVEVATAVEPAVEQIDQDIDTLQWWSGDEIRAAFVDAGKGLRGPGTGGWWTERYRPGGEIVGRIAGRVYSGNWSIDGDVICFNYVKSIGLRRSLRRDWCGHLAISDDTILQWNEDGEKEQVKIGVVE